MIYLKFHDTRDRVRMGQQKQEGNLAKLDNLLFSLNVNWLGPKAA